MTESDSFLGELQIAVSKHDGELLRATIGRALRDIHLVNRDVRFDCDRGDPEDVWRWWADSWC